jgi:Asp-tRNA(Asn)/Glu-tRNA(Gln) amidotransferase A subunit family amidase
VDAVTNPSVERLMRAGAIVHARSACPEFCWAWVCYSRLHGVTRNPWKREVTPGGSSGGSAAALAAGTSVLATGTDSGGSIRMPSAMCGVVGYKPPYGRNPQNWPDNFDMYNHIGPMARSVADAALMQNVMSGPHPGDHTTVKPRLRIPSVLKDIRGFKIAYSVDLGCFEVAGDVRRNTMAVLAALAEAGAEVTEVPTDWAQAAADATGDYGSHLYADMFLDAVQNHGDVLSDYTPFFARYCEQATQAKFRAAYRIAGEVGERFGTLMKSYDAFVCPTVTTTEVPADMPPWQEGFTVNGRPVNPDGGYVMTSIFNMLSRCPVLAMPSGLGENGVPTGIQIVGRTFDDISVFRVGAALERAGFSFAGLRGGEKLGG